MKRGFKNSREFDDYDIEGERKKHEEWNGFKEKEVERVIKAKTRLFEAEAKLH